MKTKINKQILVLNYLNIFWSKFLFKKQPFLLFSTVMFFLYYDIVFKSINKV